MIELDKLGRPFEVEIDSDAVVGSRIEFLELSMGPMTMHPGPIFYHELDRPVYLQAGDTLTITWNIRCV